MFSFCLRKVNLGYETHMVTNSMSPEYRSLISFVSLFPSGNSVKDQ